MMQPDQAQSLTEPTDNPSEGAGGTTDGTKGDTRAGRHGGEQMPSHGERLVGRLRPSLSYLLNPFAETTRSIKKPVTILFLSLVITSVIASLLWMGVSMLMPDLESVVETSPSHEYATMTAGMTSWSECLLGFFDALPTVLMPFVAAVLMLLLRDRRPGTVISQEGRFRWRVALLAWPALIPLGAETAWTLFECRGQIVLSNIEPLPAMAYLAYTGIAIVLEDLVFRGYLRQVIFAWVGNRKGMHDSLYGQRTAMALATLVATFVFTIGHPYDFLGVIAVMVFGLFSCWIVDLTGGLEIAILIHLGYDFTSFVADALLPGVTLGGTSGTMLDFAIEIGMTLLMFVPPAILYARRHKTDEALVTTIPDTPPTGRQIKARRIKVTVASVISVVCLAMFVIRDHSGTMQTSAMEPRIHSGDVLLFEPQQEYEVGDIVLAYWESTDEDGEPLGVTCIRQVTGVAGDTVTVDGKEVTLDDGEYLVASANPDAEHGTECHNAIVPHYDIEGKITYRLLPSFGNLEN